MVKLDTKNPNIVILYLKNGNKNAFYDIPFILYHFFQFRYFYAVFGQQFIDLLTMLHIYCHFCHKRMKMNEVI